MLDKETLLALCGSGGVVAMLITLFNSITTRLDARKKRLSDGKQEVIADAVEMRRIQAEVEGKQTDVLVENLWKLVKEKEDELAEANAKLEECEKAEILTRPTLRRINTLIRRIRNEMDSLNLIILTEEETNVFARRWGNVKVILSDLEEILDGQKEE